MADSGNDGIDQQISRFITYKPYTYIKVPAESYWAESMYACYQATVVPDFDHIFLLNNDVFLFESAIEQLHECARRNRDAIIVGQLWDPIVNSHAYGGLMKSGIHPLRYERLLGARVDTDVDAIQGNCVLLPRVSFTNGLYLNPQYRHNYADLDLGIRAKKLGIRVIVAPGYLGECTVGQRKPGTNVTERWKQFRSPLGTPLKSQVLILKQTAGKWIWWIWLIPPLIRLFTGRSPKLNSK